MTHDVTELRVGWTTAKFWVIGCSLLPILGFIADKFGRKSYLVINIIIIRAITSSLILVLGHTVYLLIHQ